MRTKNEFSEPEKQNSYVNELEVNDGRNYRCPESTVPFRFKKTRRI